MTVSYNAVKKNKTLNKYFKENLILFFTPLSTDTFTPIQGFLKAAENYYIHDKGFLKTLPSVYLDLTVNRKDGDN